MPGPGLRRFRQFDGLFGRAGLVALTPKLSQYFGIDKGLLVLRAPEDAGLQLEDGDVLLGMSLGARPTFSATRSRSVRHRKRVGPEVCWRRRREPIHGDCDSNIPVADAAASRPPTQRASAL